MIFEIHLNSIIKNKHSSNLSILKKENIMKKHLLITYILIIYGFTAYAQPGTIDLTFNSANVGPNNLGKISTTSIQSDGKIIIGGSFISYNGTIIKNSIARLNTDGTLDTTFDTTIGFNFGNVTPPYVSTTAIQSNGKIIIGGSFDHYATTYSPRIARLNSNGTPDTTFNVGDGANGAVKSISIQSDGKIIIAGDFTSYNGIARNRIARLNTNGTLDTSFNVGNGANNTVSTTVIQNNGKIVIGGKFSSYNGIAKWQIARLNTNGTLDTTFNTFSNIGVPYGINSLAIQSDGKIIAVGNIPLYSTNTTTSSIVRFNIDGTLDNTFNNYLGVVQPFDIYTTSIQSDGKIIIGGTFFTINGISRNRIARMNTDGTLDTSFNPGTGLGTESNNYISTISIQSDGKIIIGGDFTAYNGIGRKSIARINGDNTLSTNLFNKNTLVIYPNPSNGIYTLQTNEINDTKSISIYTLLGQKIYDAVISSNETTIDISNQPKGVYLYKVLGEEGETKSGKLVIE